MSNIIRLTCCVWFFGRLCQRFQDNNNNYNNNYNYSNTTTTITTTTTTTTNNNNNKIFNCKYVILLINKKWLILTWNEPVQMQVEWFKWSGPSCTSVVWQDNALFGSGASYSVQEDTWFILNAFHMLLLCLPYVLHSLVVQERDTKIVSALYSHELIKKLFNHYDVCRSPLVRLLQCNASLSLVICWSTSFSVIPGTPSRFNCSLIVWRSKATSPLFHSKMQLDSLDIKME